MSNAGDRLIAAAKKLMADAKNEHVWAVCAYLRDGKTCRKCPRSETRNGEAFQRMCFALAEETIQVVDSTRIEGKEKP